MIFTSTILLQFAFSQYGTYILFSWDIMEPIMACVSLTDVIAGYFFWMYCGKPWDLDSFRGHFYDRALDKVLKKNGTTKQEYKMLVDCRK